MPPDPTVLHAIGRGDLFDALKVLNARTPYRFTGVYTFDTRS